MMNYIFCRNKKSKDQEAKEAVRKEFFNYSDQKKAVTRAARESAEDQKILVEKYDRLVRTE